MTLSHEELRDALGAHALGQLDADLRREVERHLLTCADCRDALAGIAPLAGALRQVSVGDLRPVGVTPPPELDERIRRAVPGPVHGTRRWIPLSAAVLAAAAVAAVTVLVVDDSRDVPTVIAVPRVDAMRGITATAGLVDHTWGLEIKLEATGLKAGERFQMWVVGQDGSRHEAGEFVGVAGTKIVCDMSSSVLLDDAASFRVVDASGHEVIAAALTS